MSVTRGTLVDAAISPTVAFATFAPQQGVTGTIVLLTALLLPVAKGPHLSSVLTLIKPDSGICVVDYTCALSHVYQV